MDTIFDHGITKTEFRKLFFYYLDKNDYLRYLDELNRLLDLYRLYRDRGDKTMTGFYRIKLQGLTENRQKENERRHIRKKIRRLHA